MSQPSSPPHPQPDPQPGAQPATGASPLLLQTKAALAAARPALGAPVVLVPTMGALHSGHRALLAKAREQAGPDGSVIVSVFVNPLQFRPGEDLDRYPRTLNDDVAMCASEGVRAVYAPSAAEMYPGGQPDVTVNPGPVGKTFEGEFRPGFFDGVLTVVLKLFHQVRPDVAVFGAKDAQQLMLVRRMVADVDLDITIASLPTVRDADGLAISSRNRYLSDANRVQALALSRGLRAGQAQAAHGGPAALAAAEKVIRGEAGLAVDYVAVVDPQTFAPVAPDYAGPALIVVAARVGSTRLIDNVPVVLAAGPDGPDTEGHSSDAADH